MDHLKPAGKQIKLSAMADGSLSVNKQSLIFVDHGCLSRCVKSNKQRGESVKFLTINETVTTDAELQKIKNMFFQQKHQRWEVPHAVSLCFTVPNKCIWDNSVLIISWDLCSLLVLRFV